MKRLLFLAFVLSGCSSPPDSNTQLPAPTPLIVIVVATPTPEPSAVAATTEPTISAVKSNDEPTAPVFRAGQSFQSFIDQSLSAIDGTQAVETAKKLSLYYLQAQSLENDEAQRARVSQDFAEVRKVEEIANLLGGLADGAANRARFLDGLITEREYRANRYATGQTLSIINSRLPKTSEESESQATLNAVKHGMN